MVRIEPISSAGLGLIRGSFEEFSARNQRIVDKPRSILYTSRCSGLALPLKCGGDVCQQLRVVALEHVVGKSDPVKKLFLS